MIALCCKNQTQHIHAMYGQTAELSMFNMAVRILTTRLWRVKTLIGSLYMFWIVPHQALNWEDVLGKHYRDSYHVCPPNVLLISMDYRSQTVSLLKEIIADYCMNHTKHILYIHSVGTMDTFVVLMKVVSRVLQGEGHCQVKILSNHA